MSIQILDLYNALYTGAGFSNQLNFDLVEIDGVFTSSSMRAGGTSLALNNLLKHSKDYPNVVVCCDSKTNFRKEISSDYKANRSYNTTQAALVHAEFSLTQAIFQFLNIPIHIADGYEGDDIIATTVNKFKDTDKLIISDDSDLGVLLDERTEIHGIRKGRGRRVYTEEDLSEYISLGKAINGDRSDNIKKLYVSDNVLRKLYAISRKAVRSRHYMEYMTEGLLKTNIKLAYLVSDVEIDINPIGIQERVPMIKRVLRELNGYSTLSREEKMSIKKILNSKV